MSDDSKQTPLEKTFGLPSLDEIQNEIDAEVYGRDEDEDDDNDDVEINMTEAELAAHLAALNSKMADIRQTGLGAEVSESMLTYSDKMKDIHTLALDKFTTIIDGVLSMEASQGAKFLSAATKLLDIAKDAQNSSMDRVIRMAKLQMEREKHDSELNGLVKPPKIIGDNSTLGSDVGNTATEGVLVVADRNELLRKAAENKGE